MRTIGGKVCVADSAGFSCVYTVDCSRPTPKFPAGYKDTHGPVVSVLMGQPSWTHRNRFYGGAPGWLNWLSVHLLISAQVMISKFVSSSPASGSVLAVWSLLKSLSLSLSLSFSLSLSKQINIKKKNRFYGDEILLTLLKLHCEPSLTPNPSLLEIGHIVPIRIIQFCNLYITIYTHTHSHFM